MAQVIALKLSSLSPFSFFFSSLFVLTLSVVSYYSLPYYSHVLPDLDDLLTPFSYYDPPPLLLVAVHSPLANGDRRRAIRRSWAQAAAPHAHLTFFSADRPCPVDSYWRLRAGECAPWRIFVPVNVNERAAQRPARVQPSKVRPGAPYDGMGFTLKFPLSLSQVGLSRRALEQWSRLMPEDEIDTTAENRHLLQNLTVELLEPTTREIFMEANFSRLELNEIPSDDGYVYLPVATEADATHQRNFEALLRIRQQNDLDLDDPNLACNMVWNKMFGEDGLVNYNVLSANGVETPFYLDSCPLVSFVFTIPDLFELRQIVSARETQNCCQDNKNTNVLSKVIEEMEDHEDMITVGANTLYDVSEDEPAILLAFLKTALSLHGFQYVMLTDDQSVFALDRIVEHLYATEDKGMIRVWRSQFRRNVPVPRFGPNAERSYQSGEYPLLPSERGSILSRDLAQYLADNADRLSGFGTVSASLGLWLAPLAPTYIHEPDVWTVGNLTAECGLRTAAFGPVSDEEDVLRRWRNYLKCGSLCKGCKHLPDRKNWQTGQESL